MMLREPWRTRLLFISFGVNLILIPVAVSFTWKRHAPITPGVPRTEMMIEHMAHDLPADDAQRLRATMENHLGDIESARVRMLAARGAMSRAIGRAPYDAKAVQSSMQVWQGAWQKWSETLGRAMLDALPTLSDQGRQDLAVAGRRRPG